MQQIGKPLPAILFRHGEAEPAAFAIEIISFLETLGRRDRTVRRVLAAFAIGGLIDGEQSAFGKLRAFGQNCLDHIGRRLGKARQIVVALIIQNVVENEIRILNWRAIARHRNPPIHHLSRSAMIGTSP